MFPFTWTTAAWFFSPQHLYFSEKINMGLELEGYYLMIHKNIHHEFNTFVWRIITLIDKNRMFIWERPGHINVSLQNEYKFRRVHITESNRCPAFYLLSAHFKGCNKIESDISTGDLIWCSPLLTKLTVCGAPGYDAERLHICLPRRDAHLQKALPVEMLVELTMKNLPTFRKTENMFKLVFI